VREFVRPISGGLAGNMGLDRLSRLSSDTRRRD
jgi:hypothetical protein